LQPQHSDIPSETPVAGTLDVAAALALATEGVRRFAPGPLWVQGEVMGLVASRAGHWYWSLAGDGVRLSACALRREATALAATLARAQVKLADGLTVRVRGTLDVYPARGQVQLRVFGIDPAVSIGAAVLARRDVRNRLSAEGLLGRQRLLEPAPCPLRVGVVAPAGQGLADLVRVLEATPWAWQVRVVTVASEGPSAPGEIARAITGLGRADLVVVTRGGGAGVTVAYDTYEVAAAVCACPAPVIVAVGHSSDASVADDCARWAVATPTAAGELCAQLVEGADTTIVDLGREIVGQSRRRLQDADREVAAVESSIADSRARLDAALVREERSAAARSARRARLAVLAAVILAVVALVLVLTR
jgi:exodeoxyribonuclease VII large subunit